MISNGDKMIGYLIGIGVLVLIIFILIIKYNKKVILDRTEENALLNHINSLKNQREDLQKDIEEQQLLMEEYQQKIIANQKQYHSLESQQEERLRANYNKLKNDLENDFNSREETIQLMLDQKRKETEKQMQLIEAAAAEQFDQAQKRIQGINAAADQVQKRFSALLEPLRQYEVEKQQRLFYTIQIPEEYKEDIDFLLTTVAQKVQHPDVINKLIWTEYVKPYLDETFKRVNIEARPGIYKITNINSGKSYIGKSTDVKKRLTDHVKASVGIRSISDQAIHHAILKDGLWNWTFEIVTYCEKDELNDLEKYYIDFFKTQEHGYNKNAGGGG